jgi:hypothetical protein
MGKDATLEGEDLLHNLTRELGNCAVMIRTLRDEGLVGTHGAQIDELLEQVDRALAGKASAILARASLLERVATEVYQLTSEHGYPRVLRRLAEVLEAQVGALNRNDLGYDDWRNL